MLLKQIFIVQVTSLAVGAVASARRRADPLDSCTQTDPVLLDACVASAIDQFTATFQGGDTSSFDYSKVASQINSLESGLTSFGLTVSSFVPDPATFTGASSHSGPYVSDIVSSYSGYTATHTGSSGSAFSFDTSSFQATQTPSTISSSNRHTITAGPSQSTGTMTAAAPSTSVVDSLGTKITPMKVVGFRTAMVAVLCGLWLV